MKIKITSGPSTRHPISWPISQARFHRRLSSLTALFALGLCFLSTSLLAQTPVGASATITLSNGASATISTTDGKFEAVEILPGDTASIELQLPPGFVNAPVAVQPLDGGLASEEITVAPEGTAALAFQAGSLPGLYRIFINTPAESVTLQFSVGDSGLP
jgi:hypothetical protein